MSGNKQPGTGAAVRTHGGSRAHTLSRRALLGAAGLGAALALRYVRPVAAWPVADDEQRRAPTRVSGAGRRAVPASSATQDAPEFSLMEQVEAWDVLLFLAGKHPRYPEANLDNLMAFSAADIIETMDTDVMDAVLARHGEAGAWTVYSLIARNVLDALLDVYGSAPVVLALDAGHGGKRGVYFDPGSQGTEWLHARQVVASLEEQASASRYGNVTVRRIFNDEIGDDFGLPPPNDRKGAASLTIRNGRGAMLAYEVDTWNRAYPDSPVALHVVSVHFNAGSGGILVLHQGSTVPEEFLDRSIAYARGYVEATRPALNATGLLPYLLRLALGTGLSDDRLLYEPNFRIGVNPLTGVDRSRLPRRYAMLQTSLMQRDYADGALRYHKLV